MSKRNQKKQSMGDQMPNQSMQMADDTADETKAPVGDAETTEAAEEASNETEGTETVGDPVNDDASE